MMTPMYLKDSIASTNNRTSITQTKKVGYYPVMFMH